MDYQELAVTAIILSGVVCACQVLLCISVFYLFVKLRRMHQTVEQLKTADNHNTESPPLGGAVRHALPLTAQPGETITVLHRDSHLPLPAQFVNKEEIAAQQTDPRQVTITEHSMEHSNPGFENSEQ